MNIDHNRIKVADLEKNQPNKILTTNDNGELEFSDINNIKTESYNALDYTAEGKALDARQGKILKDLIDTINVLLASDNINLNTIQELANAIESIQNSLNSILVNDLTTGGNTKALTAEMGKSLKGLYDTLVTTAGGKEDVSNKSQDIETDKTSTSKYSSVKQIYDWAVAKFVQAANIKTVNGNNLIGTGNITTPDMTTNTAQEVTALKTFRAGMFGLRNTANTFTSFFASAVTASRTWTWPDKSGTVAMTSDIVAQLNGTVNFLVKFGTATTGTLSRLFDNGTCFGIGTVNTPTKDITLGNQQNREIAIEESDNISNGSDLTISAGRTIDYSSGLFIATNQTIRNYTAISCHINGDVYVASTVGVYVQINSIGSYGLLITGNFSSVYCHTNGDVWATVSNGDIYKRTGGTGSFVAQGQVSRMWSDISVNASGDVFASVGDIFSTGDIYKKTGGIGTFNALGLNPLKYYCIGINQTTGDIYTGCYNGDIYKQTGGTGSFNGLGQTIRNWSGLYIQSNNDVWATAGGNGWSSDLFKQTSGAGNFIAQGVTSSQCSGFSMHSNGTKYLCFYNGDIYTKTTGKGSSNLNGGTYKTKAGTGKGTGKSRIEFYTGQKTTSGTDMQLETLRAYIDENGFFVYLTPPIYANDADADADSNLPSGAYYKVTGNRTLFQKP